MSYQDGWAAINLEMPARVPRTEYSAEGHWELISAVTGMDVSVGSSSEMKAKASHAFKQAWNYDFLWNILTYNQVFGDKYTKMGHAEYASGGTDYDNEIRQLYDDPEKALGFDPWELYGERDQSILIKEFNQHYENSCNLHFTIMMYMKNSAGVRKVNSKNSGGCL